MNCNNLKEIQNGLADTWDAIANDVLGGDESATIARENVIEMVLDANRVDMYADFSADAAEVWKNLSFEEKLDVANKTFTYEVYGY